MRASRVFSLPRSLKTRAVIPTLVAQRVAPMNIWASWGASGMKYADTPHPRKNGAITPSTATSNDDPPTSIISFKSASSPTSNNRMITPSSASAAMVPFVFSDSAPPKPSMTKLPNTIPATSSPKTAGWRRRSNNSPPSFASTSITATPIRTAGSSPWSLPPSTAA